jgi:hypothetical protein
MSMLLDKEVVNKLDAMKIKYDALSTSNSPEDEEEKALIEDTIQKYNTYKEITLMMGKLRKMWRSEESERRRTRQLNSFTSLYKGRVEIEESLREKLGFSADKSKTLQGLEEISKWDGEIEKLEKKLRSVEITLPQGMSTREEKFGAL